MREVKQIDEGGFDTREDARKRAQLLISIGGRVIEGGAREDGSWGFTGEIRVDDTRYEVDGTFHCGRCAGTGQFITYVENGKPRGPGGICFRCEGKGRHNRADRKRNFWHDVLAFCRID